ncbi:MAG: TlpA family protein disulfide reductase [Bacteroidales bacterium]|nr:TlpA family protein disulfide reductase [Bacteroidales bacterium]
MFVKNSMRLQVGIVILYAAFFLHAQTNPSLPKIELKTMDGKIISTDSIQNNGKPIIMSFWATWCKPCIKELNIFAEHYDEWVEETGVKLFAINVDDQRTFASVKTLVNGKAWPFIVYCDPNGEFKRAMNVVNIPHTFILDGERKIVWQHSTFAEGAEEEVIEVVRNLVKK